MNIRLLLVDENTLFRKGLVALLTQQADLTIAGDLASGREATQACTGLEPDVIVMEIRLAESSGLDIAAQLKRRPNAGQDPDPDRLADRGACACRAASGCGRLCPERCQP